MFRKSAILLMLILLITGCNTNNDDNDHLEQLAEKDKIINGKNDEIVNLNEENSMLNKEIQYLNSLLEEAIAKDYDYEALNQEEKITNNNIENTHAQEDDEEDNEKAIELNTIGFDLFQEARYEEALEYFLLSIEADEDYVNAYYNYACTLCALMTTDYPSWYFMRDSIHTHLQKVLDINPNYLENIEANPDFELIRKDFKYHQLFGYTTDDDMDIQYLLLNLEWYINGPGVITPLGGLTFNEDGTFVFSYIELNGYEEPGWEYKNIYTSGTYEVKDSIIYFELDENMILHKTYKDFFEKENENNVVEFQGYLLQDGTLIIDIFEFPIHNWVDEFSS